MTSAKDDAFRPQTGVVVLTVCGDNVLYREAAEITVDSVLRRTDLNVFVGVDFGVPSAWVDNERVECFALHGADNLGERPLFLRKFETLAALCQQQSHTLLLQMDVDAVVSSSISAKDLDSALGQSVFGMVEQKTIVGADHDRSFFLRHYCDHVLPWFGTTDSPDLEEFRFFNSGVVLARATAMREFLLWAREQVGKRPAHHRVGNHMIADQDYFQYWCNTLNRGSCTELPWHWNHCEHWDRDYPRAGGLIHHFSNFCNGPTPDTIKRMSTLHTESKP